MFVLVFPHWITFRPPNCDDGCSHHAEYKLITNTTDICPANTVTVSGQDDTTCTVAAASCSGRAASTVGHPTNERTDNRQPWCIDRASSSSHLQGRELGKTGGVHGIVQFAESQAGAEVRPAGGEDDAASGKVKPNQIAPAP